MYRVAKITGRLGALLLGIVIVWLVVEFLHKPIKVEVPASFRGWVTITFNKPDCKPLSKEGLYLVVRINESGKSCTSDDNPYRNWRWTRFFFVNQDAQKSAIPDTMASVVGWKRPDRNRSYEEGYLFVGTRDELNHAGGPHS